MPGAVTTTSARTTPSKLHSQKKTKTDPFTTSFPSIDARIAALKKRGLPQLPYILTLHEVRRPEEHVELEIQCASRGGVPYCGHIGEWEHKTLYTFIPRKGEPLLYTTPHPGFVPGKKGMLAQPSKKKISLADYKKRQDGTTPVSDGEVAEWVLTNGAHHDMERRSPSGRSADSSSSGKLHETSQKSAHAEMNGSSKRPAANSLEQDNVKRSRPASRDDHKSNHAAPLPPLLSPELPPLPPLPPMLSPMSSLAEEEAELEALRHELPLTPPQQTAKKSQVSNSVGRSRSASPGVDAVKAKMDGRERKKKAEVRSPPRDSYKSASQTARTATSRSDSPGTKHGRETEDHDSGAVASPAKKIKSEKGDTIENGVSRGKPHQHSHSVSNVSIPNTPLPTITPKTKALIEKMQSEADRLSNSARSLKRSMDARFGTKQSQSQSQSQPPSGSDQILAVAEGIDSILCFVLSFAYTDEIASLQGTAMSRGTWRSLTQLLKFVEVRTEPFREIYEALRQLGVVIRALALEDEMRDVDSRTSKPSSSSDKPTTLYKSWREFRSQASHAVHFGQPERLKPLLPETWEASKQPFGEKKPRPGHLSGGYRLPFVGGVSSPLEAVRFGNQALKEWTALKKVNYECKCMN